MNKCNIENGSILIHQQICIGMDYTDIVNKFTNKTIEEFVNIKNEHCKRIVFQEELYGILSEYHIYVKNNKVYKFVIIQESKNIEEIIDKLEKEIKKDYPEFRNRKLIKNQYYLEIQVSKDKTKSCIVLKKIGRNYLPI